MSSGVCGFGRHRRLELNGEDDDRSLQGHHEPPKQQLIGEGGIPPVFNATIKAVGQGPEQGGFRRRESEGGCDKRGNKDEAGDGDDDQRKGGETDDRTALKSETERREREREQRRRVEIE